MSDIVKNPMRVGNFTSSECFKLIEKGSRPMTEDELKQHKEENPKSRKKNIDDGFAAGGETYIRHKGQERKRKRSMSMDAYSKAISWGELGELRVYDLVGLEYSLQSKETQRHPEIDFWTGSRDMIIPSVKIAEIKCYYPEKGCDYADMLLAKEVWRFREDFPQEYWQIVSNCAINQVPNGEAILYMPYDSEADDIAHLIDTYDEPDQWRYRWIWDHIADGDLWKLPFQPDNSDYPNLITWEFEIPESDIQYLTERIVEANQMIEI